MSPPQLWNCTLLLLLASLIIYTAAKTEVIMARGNTNSIAWYDWNELNDYHQLKRTSYPSFHLLKNIACAIYTSVQNLHQFMVACIDIVLFEIIGILPSPSWELPPLAKGPNYDTLSRRSLIAQTEDHKCNKLADYAEQQACLKNAAQHEKIYVIIASVVVGLACLVFGALMIRYLRRYKAVALREQDAAVKMVGLGRGLGSEVTDARSASSNSLQKKDVEKDVEANDDDLIASTWKVAHSRQSSSAWRRLLHAGQSASIEQAENNFLAPPTSEFPPRIPTPQLPSTAIFLSDSARARVWLQRKPLNGLAAFEDDEFFVKKGLVIPEIRIISAGSS